MDLFTSTNRNKLKITKLPDDFDYNSYRILNEDLRDFSNYKLKSHYINFGSKENRPYKLNKNVSVSDKIVEVINHNKIVELNQTNNEIKANNREILPNDFNHSTYKSINSDLINLSNNELEAHYINYGIKEKRAYKFDLPEGFNCEQYKELNQDLLNLNDNELKIHYLRYGRNEGRQYKFNLPEDFSVVEYKVINTDLKGMNDKKAIVHYLKYGKNEKRTYKYNFPEDFNYNEYKLIHELDNNTSVNDIKLHFMTSGTRIYKNNSNYGNYIDIPKINVHSNINTVYIISNNNSGGSCKYINDIINTYKNVNFIYISESDNLYGINFEDNDILFIQQLMGTNISLTDIKFIKENFNCEIILTVHDFCWFHSEIINKFEMHAYNWHGKYLDDQIEISKDAIEIFELSNFVIFPSQFVYDKYSEYIDNSNFIYSDHIDIKTEEFTNNIPPIFNEINIGVFHEFSEYKGSEFVIHLMNKYKTYKDKKINFKITGYNIERYTESNFFQKIKKYNIHGLILLNKWGETYCYALTKCLNAGLPILYNNFGSFKQRVPKTNNNFKVFENENEVNDINHLETQFIEFLDHIIENSGNNSAIVNNPEINVPPLYNRIFLNDIYNKNIVIITSKIKVSNNSLSYTKNRSIYSMGERYTQTLETIKSIKKYIPNCYIVLFDNSVLPVNIVNRLRSETNKFINITDNKILNNETDNCIYKGIAELYQLLTLYDTFLKHLDDKIIGKNFFKISGRYLLNDSFDYSQYDNEHNIFKRDKNLMHMKYYYTSFYKIGSSFLHEFFGKLKLVYENRELYQTMNMEEFVAQSIDYNFNEVDNLGLTQKIAVWSEISNI